MLKSLFARMIGGRGGSKVPNRIRPTLESLEERIVPATTWYWQDTNSDHMASEPANWVDQNGNQATQIPQPADTLIFDSAHSKDYVLWNTMVEVNSISVRCGIEWQADKTGHYVQSDTGVTISGNQQVPATLIIDSLVSNDGVLKLINGSHVAIGLNLWQDQFSTLQIKGGTDAHGSNSITEDANSVGSSYIKINSDGEMDYLGNPSNVANYQDYIEPFIINDGIFTSNGGNPTASQAGSYFIVGSTSSTSGYSFENDAAASLEGSVTLAMNSGGGYAQVFNTASETDSIGGRSTTDNVLSVSGGGKITITTGYIKFSGSSNTSFSDLRFRGGNVETKCEVDLNFDGSTSGNNDVLEDSDTNITWQWDAGSSVSPAVENLPGVTTGQWQVVKYAKQWTGSPPTPSVLQPYHGLTTNQASNSFMGNRSQVEVAKSQLDR
jgi:hypothetical protein